MASINKVDIILITLYDKITTITMDIVSLTGKRLHKNHLFPFMAKAAHSYTQVNLMGV
jgi:hypothetical protein